MSVATTKSRTDETQGSTILWLEKLASHAEYCVTSKADLITIPAAQHFPNFLRGPKTMNPNTRVGLRINPNARDVVRLAVGEFNAL